jgi:hypothetical protein
MVPGTLAVLGAIVLLAFEASKKKRATGAKFIDGHPTDPGMTSEQLQAHNTLLLVPQTDPMWIAALEGWARDLRLRGFVNSAACLEQRANALRMVGAPPFVPGVAPYMPR